MAEQKLIRDYSFDAVRSVLMCGVVLLHITKVAGNFQTASMSGVIYITCISFVMQGFMFLSGYFSKDAELCRKTAFRAFAWPYLLGIPVFYFTRLFFFGKASLQLDIPPFALWFLLVLFVYRIFLKNYIKIPHLLEISLIAYLLAGQCDFLDDRFALGRMVSDFPFFLLGYYCRPEHLQKIRSLKKSLCAVLAACLLALSCLLAFSPRTFPVSFYLLKAPASALSIPWYEDILGRMLIFVIACGWLLLLLNIMPNRKSYMAYIGRNTMSIYILHIFVRYFIQKNGITLGIFPEHPVLYYVLIFVFAGITVAVLSSPPVVKAFNFVVNGSYRLFMWLLSVINGLLEYIHRFIMKILNAVIQLIQRLSQ